MNKASSHYKLDIKSLLERANSATKLNFAVIIRCVFIVLFIFLISTSIYLQVFNIETMQDLELLQTETYYFNMILVVVLAPLWAGIAMLSVKTERKQAVNTLTLFSYIRMSLSLGIAALCISLLTQIGMTLILPAIYLFITTIFSKLLIADKNMNPFVAIKTSIQIANKHLLQLTMVFVIFFIAALVLGTLTFGLAFIWITPLYYNATGILYNDLFSDARDPQIINTEPQTEDAHFDA